MFICNGINIFGCCISPSLLDLWIPKGAILNLHLWTQHTKLERRTKMETISGHYLVIPTKEVKSWFTLYPLYILGWYYLDLEFQKKSFTIWFKSYNLDLSQIKADNHLHCIKVSSENNIRGHSKTMLTIFCSILTT